MKKKGIIVLMGIVMLIIIGVYTGIQNPIIGKWIAGSARIVGKPIPCNIYINGVISENAKIFHQLTSFDGATEKNNFILFIPNQKESDGRNILIIDRKDSLIKLPNSHKRDYDIIGSYLFQSQAGSKTMFPINNDIKGMRFEPDLTLEPDLITFNLPKWSEYDITSVKIQLIKH